MVLAVVAFAGLCGVAVRQGVRFRHSASIWLAGSFAALALTATVASQLDRVRTPGPAFAVLVGTALGLVLHPVALLQFSHTLRPVSRRARLGLVVVAGILLAAVVAIGVADPFAFDDEDGSVSPVAGAVLAALSLTWLAVTGIVGTRLIRFGRALTSSVGRARAWTMAGSVLILGPAVALPFLVSQLTQVTGVTLALVACLFTWLGYVPPRWLRWTWAREDTRRLTTAELDALHTRSDELTPWLRTVMEVWDGDAAWFQVDGRTIAAVGDVPATGTEVATTRTVGTDVRIEHLARGTWQLVADAAGGHLAVATRLDPVLFGDEASELLLATAGRMRSAETRRRLAADSRHQQEELHRAETHRLRDDVLSTLSHELRTPLVTIRGVPELLVARWEQMSADEIHRMLGRVHANALDLHRLVESTLLLAQLRTREVLPKVDDHSLREVSDEAIDRLERVGVDLARVTIDVPTSGMDVHTDPVLAGAALAELVHNGLVFSDAPAEVRVEARVAATTIHLDVIDEGRGISGTDTDHLREPFHRAGELLTRDRRGLGLGLTLASDLAVVLQADLVARSPAGGGTVVTLSLPVATT